MRTTSRFAAFIAARGSASRPSGSARKTSTAQGMTTKEVSGTASRLAAMEKAATRLKW
jgi:hypothetical protein